MLESVLAVRRGGLPIEWVLVIIGVVTVGSIISWAWQKSQKNKKKVRRAPSCKISELAGKSSARITGDVKPIGDKTVKAPLTGRACLFYVLKVEREVDGAWKVLVHESHGVPFHVVDDSGTALVDPDAATVELDNEPQTGDFASLGEAADGFRKRHDVPSKNVRYSEWILAGGERVAAIGGGAKAKGDKVIRLTSAEGPVAITAA